MALRLCFRAAAGIVILSLLTCTSGGPATKSITTGNSNLTRYVLRDESLSDAATAQRICSEEPGGSLLFLSSLTELQMIIETLNLQNDSNPLWTSAVVKFASSSSPSLEWSNTNTSFTLPLTPSSIKNVRLARAAMSRPRRFALSRHRRSPKDDGCGSETPTTPKPVTTTPASCLKQTCTGVQPACTEIEKRNCSVSSPPVCKASAKNCSVDCGDPNACIITQPVCTLDVDPSKPLCRLVTPLPECEVIEDPVCTVISPGECFSKEEMCEQDDHICLPVTRPCNQSCSQMECVSVKPICSDGKICPNVTSCTRPFVDCSPEYCKSVVTICPPPKVHCSPPVIICNPPNISCSKPKLYCPLPEVICDSPNITCTKPKVKCPDPLVQCEPEVSHCEPAQTECSQPRLDCPGPQISCKNSTCWDGTTSPPEETTSPPAETTSPPEETTSPPEETTSPPVETTTCGCAPCSEEVEIVYKKMCVSFQVVKGKVEWISESCSVKHNFICKYENPVAGK